MIDWHSHILPKLDDGSKSVEESLEMLKMLKAQGVDTVCATPHYYANDNSVDRFLERRQRSAEELLSATDESCPRIVLGAEVRYYPGISRLDDLSRLTVGDTDLLLLEMPFASWREYTLRELCELSCGGEVTVILAHIERYISYQKENIWRTIEENGILVQSNAEFFTGFKTRRKALHLLSEGKIQFVGTDCHNLTTRPPNIKEAYDRIEKKTGHTFTSQMIEYGYSVLDKTRIKNF